MSKVIVNVGFTGTGKTVGTKEIIKGLHVPLFIYDVNNEYKEFSGAVIKPFEQFLAEANLKKNTCIVFEEATIFFSHASSTKEIMELLVRKRHSKNLIILNFHSLRKVPLFILDFTDYLILRKTNDNPENIRKKFEDYEKIYSAFQQINSSKNKFENQFIKLQ